jgi:uncharacterized membrane protein
MDARLDWALDGLASDPSVMVLGWVVLVLGALRLVRLASSRSHALSRARLDDEFARGELSIDEYRHRRTIIERT